MENVQSLGAILKVVIMPGTTDTTPFQGFNIEFVGLQTAELLLNSTKIPLNITDIFDGAEDPDYSRSHNLLLLSKESISRNDFIFNHPFVVIIFDRNDGSFALNLAKKFTFEPVLFGEHKKSHIKPSSKLSCYSFDNILFNRIRKIEESISKNGRFDSLSKSYNKRGVTLKTSSLISRVNNATRPNEELIESLGYKLKGAVPMKPGSSKRIFIEAILESLKVYRGVIDEKDDKEIVAFCPGMYRHIYNNTFPLWAELRKELNEDEMKFINGLLRNPDYSGFRTEIKHDFHPGNIYEHKIIGPFLRIRQTELKLFTAAVSILAHIKRKPTFRLPNSINFLGGKLKVIEDLAKTKGIYSKQFIDRAMAFNKVVRKILGAKLINEINSNYKKVSFICDIPLDWVRFERLPLMLTHEISRIGSTPGNMLLVMNSSYPEIKIKASELKDVLIIRSFTPDDRLKFHLETALDQYQKMMPNTTINLIDVYSREDLIDSLNEFHGSTLVLDCHGDHGGESEPGWLLIGEDKVDVWGLAKITRVPPIVILSACLTSAISGSHASVANGFLSAGAISVLGTLLPVNSIDSAVFVSRLLYRLSTFPEILSKRFTHANLRLIISVFFRMSYVTDILRAFCANKIITSEDYERIHIEANSKINMLHQDWYDFVLEEISLSTSISIENVEKAIYKKLFISETMCYSQIGFPESLTVDLRN